jgi:hypothetical protein
MTAIDLPPEGGRHEKTIGRISWKYTVSWLPALAGRG